MTVDGSNDSLIKPQGVDGPYTLTDEDVGEVLPTSSDDDSSDTSDVSKTESVDLEDGLDV